MNPENPAHNVPRRLTHALFSALALCLCLTGCFSSKPPPGPTRDHELERLSRVARAAFEHGNPHQAATAYQAALTRARALDQAAEIGNAAYNLAICQSAAGNHDDARIQLLEAEMELIRANANLADVFLVQAKVARWQNHPQEALTFAEKVLSHPASTPAPEHRAQVALLRGSLACDQRDAVTARIALSTASKALHSLPDPAGHAELAQLAGRTDSLENQPEAAALQFDREAAFWQEAGRPHDLAQALARAGQAWQEAGQNSTAAERFFRAARSRFAQGNQAQSLEWIRNAVALAETGTDGPLKQRALTLQTAIEEASPPQPPHL